eukprot:TRINITY_DN56132_c0_g1_i1.p1 TRINITY_DN56132_c0_g1~~TRINITY_DN56132_c0_g1_i1.p1  ORF type:complete len:516 (-),score=128.13 TRINITY_DN56132_c0_g1_i1:178-1629(-)
MEGLFSSLAPASVAPPLPDKGEKTLHRCMSASESTQAPGSPGGSTPMTPQPMTPQCGNSVSMYSTDLASIEDPAAWLAQTHATLGYAKGLAPKMEAQLVKNHSIEMDNSYALAVKEQLRDKMAANTDLIRILEAEMRGVDDCVREVSDSLLFLKRALWTKWAPLCIVRKRIEIREQRPVQERTHDAWQRAMEVEVEVLTTTREEIQEIIEMTKDLLPPLYDAKQVMFEDLNQKRRTNRLDHNVLMESHGRGIPKSEECIFDPLSEVMGTQRPSHPVHDGAEPGIGIHNEVAWRQRLETTRGQVLRLLEGTRKQLKRNKELVLVKEQRCELATAQTVATMKQHVAWLAASKIPIEEQVLELEKVTYAGELSVHRTSKRLNQHAAPIRMLSRQMAQRQERIPEEHIRDRVDERMDAHLAAVKQFVEALTPHVVWTAELVEDVRATRRSLQQALELKTRALRVDMMCVKPKQAWINEATTAEVRRA